MPNQEASPLQKVLPQTKTGKNHVGGRIKSFPLTRWALQLILQRKRRIWPESYQYNRWHDSQSSLTQLNDLKEGAREEKNKGNILNYQERRIIDVTNINREKPSPSEKFHCPE